MINYNYEICKKVHAIAGVTCNSKRYMYNGWMRKTVDPGFKTNNGTRNIGDVPCELMPYDWITDQDSYCINTALCKLDKATKADLKGTLCFDFKKDKHKTYFAVRKDIFDQNNRNYIPPQTVKSLYKQINRFKPCKKGLGYRRHPVTLDCIKCAKLSDEIHSSMNLCLPYNSFEAVKPVDVQRAIPFHFQEDTPPRTQTINKTKTIKTIKSVSPVVKKSPSVAKKICPPGKVVNPKTNRCILEKNKS